MKEPDKIYVHEASAPELAEPVLKEYHIEYIRKDALLELIKEEEQFWDDGELIFRRLKEEISSL